jgi:transposase-like protein
MVEEMLAARGIVVSHESVRQWRWCTNRVVGAERRL